MSTFFFFKTNSTKKKGKKELNNEQNLIKREGRGRREKEMGRKEILGY